MTQRLKVGLFMLLACSAACLVPNALASEWDKQTVITFSAPVEIPGQVLPAGTYVFKLADTPDRDVVQIFTEDQRHLLTSVLVIRDQRIEPSDRTVMTFQERAPDAPEALHSWFYPGDTGGFEFIYPKSRRQYVARSEQSVATPEPTPAPHSPEQSQAAVEQPTPEPQSTAVMREREELIIAQEIPSTPAENPPPAEDTATGTLPQTAGNFAIFALLGFGLLSGGFAALRFAAKQG